MTEVKSGPDSHIYYALKVAAVKKPCCIEKPLTPGYRDSLRIFKAFKKKKTPLFVDHWLHETGVSETGSWNLRCDQNLDRVEISTSVERLSVNP